jgi:hypothetical protein
MTYTGRTRLGHRVTSGPRSDGQHDAACGCGWRGTPGDDQQAFLEARSHASRCGGPRDRR